MRWLLRCGVLLWGVLLAASPAFGKGWDPLGYTLRMSAFGTSDAFPGSLGSGPDHGLETATVVGTGIRLSKSSKLGVTASGGGLLQQQFARANYGWFGAGTMLRRNKSQYTLDGEWIPKRNKFPADPEEGGEFSRLGLTAGWRYSLGTRVRLRMEGTVDRDNFIPLFDTRDTRGRELYSVVTFTPVKGTDLRAEATLAHDEASAGKYTKDTRTVGGGVAWSDSNWRADLSLRSGVRRYPDALAGESSFQRRDQWIDARLRLTRTLRAGLAATLGVTLADQTSSRLDRAYTVQSLALGVEWSGGGK